MTRVRGICYVDLSGDLEQTICGEAPDLEQVTIYMSSATCPGCIAAIQGRIEALRPPREQGAAV